MAFSTNGPTLVTRNKLWDVATRTNIATLSGSFHSVAISPDGTILASGSDDGSVLLWNMVPYIKQRQTPNPDFNGDGAVGFADFLLFASQFGLSRGDAGYDARYDLDGDETIGFSDFLIFVNAFGKEGS